MKMEIPPQMAEALRLTRAGRLVEATVLLRSGLLGGGHSPATAPTEAPEPVIDLVPERVTDTSRPTEPSLRHGASATASAAGDGAGSSEEHAFAGPVAELRYRLYTPAGATANMPLIVMLHGCTQSPEDFARGTGMNRLADEFGFLVAYPRQTQAANAQKCWNWFRPGDQRRDRGEPALIAGLTREVIAARNADPARVYVAGLSAGGAAAAIMASAYPDIYAAVGIHSGLDCGAARDMSSALAAMRGGAGSGKPASKDRRLVPLITFHGDGDATVNEINSRQIVAGALAAGGELTTRLEHGTTASERGFTRAVSADADGRALIEQWTVHGLGHAWSGGDAAGSYTDPTGPDASREMVRFFLEHTRAESRDDAPR